jgi:phosphoglycerate dehydrogenase-like enzyme
MTFQIALTGDFQKDGKTVYPDFDLGQLKAARGIKYSFFTEHKSEIEPEQLKGFQGVIVLTPKVTSHSLSQSQDLLAVSRFGVGYDSVDVSACTEADVVLCITAGAVDRPVAEATVGWMIALGHRIIIKDKLVRKGLWHQRSEYMGGELRDRTLGVVGLGGIGSVVIELLKGFGMKQPLVYDPFMDEINAEKLGVKKVELHELMKHSDFITLHCPLNEHTRDLISHRELDLMKSSSFIINTARGGIINEDALFKALSEKKIAGAALDCFNDEPVLKPNRFSELDNVILAPHSIAWTQELFRDIGMMCSQHMIDLANGIRPHGVVNPEIFDRPSFQEKWKALRVQPNPISS